MTKRRILAHAIAGAGAGFGLFMALTLAARTAAFDPCTMWTWVPPSRRLSALWFAAGAAVLVANAFVAIPRRARGACAAIVASLAALQAFAAARFLFLLGAGRVRSALPIPSSLLLGLLLAAVARQVLAQEAPDRFAWRGLVGAATMAALPLVLMITFGATDYARPADCAVVLGARVYADGTMSLALADRVDEAVRLYHQGKVRRIVMSGAVDPETGISEAMAMRARAAAAAVPDDAILVDELGATTADTAHNVSAMMIDHRYRSALLVSHYYHLLRTKMLFARYGQSTYTVPAHMSRHLAKEPWFLTREVLAFYHTLLLQ